VCSGAFFEHNRVELKVSASKFHLNEADIRLALGITFVEGLNVSTDAQRGLAHLRIACQHASAQVISPATPPKYAHTHTDAHTHTHKHTHKHARTHTHSLTHTHCLPLVFLVKSWSMIYAYHRDI